MDRISYESVLKKLKDERIEFKDIKKEHKDFVSLTATFEKNQIRPITIDSIFLLNDTFHISQDGQTAFCAGKDYTIRVLQRDDSLPADEKFKEVCTLKGHTKHITGLSLS